jgi:hypothetical protein
LSEELQEAVVQHALAMHALGAQPERVIVEMGQVLDEVSAEAFASTQRSTVWVDANALRASVVRWSLDTYFGVGG